nr:reverse transcriptase domain-containing protein [Tanacetum cinerariifolium]
MEYLKEGTLPSDRKEARKIYIKAQEYELLEGVLYRRSFLTPWLRCVRPLQAEYVIREIHEGSCSMHAGPRSVVAKAIRLGYYWPTIHRDAPFPKGPGKVKFFIVAMDYFTKWIEAKAVATITGSQAHRTMIKLNHGDTPFSLTYGMHRTTTVDVVYNNEELQLNLDLLEERCKRNAIREAKAKLKMTKYYNARVRGVAFKPGYFVYRSNDASHAVDGRKLGPK